VVRWAIVAVALTLGALLLFRMTVHKLLYPAPPLASTADPSLGPNAEQVWLETADGRIEAFHLAPASPPDAPAPLVIYAHGNGELIDVWIDQFATLRARGVSVLLVEYPGYGRSAGRPSQASIARAMVAAYDWAAARPGVDRARIVGWGRSLGGGAICALARERTLGALVLESTFRSVRAIASEVFRVPGFLVRDAFDNLEVVRAFPGPVLLLHGEHDASIPIAHAHGLLAANAHAELHVLPCGHNDCEPPWDLLEPFILAESPRAAPRP
jgi:fermentation-respiration switch protein FrsA (DUF1100 family)